jgi:hypothetical protein
LPWIVTPAFASAAASSLLAATTSLALPVSDSHSA